MQLTMCPASGSVLSCYNDEPYASLPGEFMKVKKIKNYLTSYEYSSLCSVQL